MVVNAKTILPWLVGAVLIAVIALYLSHKPAQRFNVAPDAQREIEKAMRR